MADVWWIKSPQTEVYGQHKRWMYNSMACFFFCLFWKTNPLLFSPQLLKDTLDTNKTKYSLHMKKRCNYMACTDPFRSFVWPVGVAFIRPLLSSLYRSVHICCVAYSCSYYTASPFLLDALWSSPCPIW